MAPIGAKKWHCTYTYITLGGAEKMGYDLKASQAKGDRALLSNLQQVPGRDNIGDVDL